jgi:2-hydroxychromene-2-carboxylate isomerase
MTEASPVDRGKPGSKLHMLSDRAGIPCPWVFRLQTPMIPKRYGPLVRAIPPVRSRRSHGAANRQSCTRTKAYDATELRRWVRDHGIAVRIARKASNRRSGWAITVGS